MRIGRQPRVVRWSTPVLIVLLGYLLLPDLRAAPVSSKSEDDIKAAYLLNFTRYVSWPDTSFQDESSPVVIGILREDVFNGALWRTVAGRTSHGRPIVVRQVSDASEVQNCHIVFVDSAVRDPLSVLRPLEGKPVLTVGNSDRFLRIGGMIEFVRARDTIQFEVNLRTVEDAGLRISSRMLSHARRVIGMSRSRGSE